MRCPTLRSWCLAVVIAAGVPAAASAQAWAPPKGEGSVSVTYETLLSRDHLDSRGRPYDRGQVARHFLVTGIDYGLTDRWVVDATVAGVAARHRGADAGHGPLDTGLYHGTVQDVRVSVGYQVPARRGWAITPYVGGSLPTHAYETRGHSGFGRNLKTLIGGVWVGRGLDPVLRDAYVQGHYGFSLVAPVEACA